MVMNILVKQKMVFVMELGLILLLMVIATRDILEMIKNMAEEPIFVLMVMYFMELGTTT